MEHRRDVKRSVKRSAVGAAFALLAIGAGCNGNTQASDNGLAASYQELASQLGKCGQTAAQCMQQTAGNQTQVQACKDAFTACADQAQAARQALEQAVAACFTAAHACSAQDGGASAHATCRDELRSCVQSNLPPAPPLPPCLQALQHCVEGGGQPKDCAQQAHQCILANLPQRAQDGGAGLGWLRDDDTAHGFPARDAGPGHLGGGATGAAGSVHLPFPLPHGAGGMGGGQPPFPIPHAAGGMGGGQLPFPLPHGAGGMGGGPAAH